MEKFINQRNPILPLKYHIPDSEGHVMPDGRLYIYGSCDEREDVYCSDKYYVVSTKDMKEWTIHDISLKGQDIPWFNDPDAPKYPGIDWSRPTPFIQKMLADAAAGGKDMKAEFEKEAQTKKPPLLFAPDCIEKDGTYYLYFCMPDDSEGVAVSDRPEGPFKHPVRLPCGGIDPAVFMDDDGQVYYYWGQLFSHGVPLNPDMKSFDPEKVVDDLVTEEQHYFHEGSSMRKIGDTYYYVYANMERGKPTSLGYATSSSPLGPFTYRGIIIDNDGCDPESWNNHGSIECVDGQWYVFYHRCSRGSQQHRRLCIEPITILPDGSIPEVKMTSQGIGQPFTPGETIMGYEACRLTGSVFIGTDEVYGEKLTHISDGDTAVFRYVKSNVGWSRARLRVSGSGRIQIWLGDKKAGTVSLSRDSPDAGDVCQVPDGTGVREVCAALDGPGGEYEQKLVFDNPCGLEVISVTLE